MINTLTSIFCRIFFVVSLFLLFIALWDKLIGLFGWTIPGLPFTPSRFFELSATMMIFVIALLLREIRDRLKSS